MTQSSLISVVMPVYNSENFLETSIISILEQTYQNFEFNIVYDISKDNSLSIIKKFQKKDKRIKLIYGDNEKIVGALNKGIANSQGEFIARMDSDDISHPLRFERQLDYIKKNGLDICGCHCSYIDESNKEKKVVRFPLKHDLCFLSLALKVPFAHPSVMIRSKFLQDHNLLYGKKGFQMAEDFDLWINMSKFNAKFGNVNEILFKYRITKNSLSKINDHKVKNDTKILTSLFLKSNKSQIINIINISHTNLIQEEEILKARLIFKIFKLNLFKNLIGLKIKNIFYGLFSQVKNFQN